MLLKQPSPPEMMTYVALPNSSSSLRLQVCGAERESLCFLAWDS